MTTMESDQIGVPDIVLRCENLATAVEFYTEELGFRLDRIFPADAPRLAHLSGHGIRIRLERTGSKAPNTQPQDEDAPIELPPLVPALVVHKAAADSWGTGRAGMQYRDLIPTRLGGRYIASHIRIPEGGPVPDYVHHHHVRFQMIFCYQGWVRLVYEDQGPPFVMRAGDCVLQPPHIRHRVLECSDAFEVVEISCPAEHVTLVDHEMNLPTETERPERDFHGQRFVFHQSEGAAWQPAAIDGFQCRSLGIDVATNGLASADVIRTLETAETVSFSHDAEFFFAFVLSGATTLVAGDQGRWSLAASDALVIPQQMRVTFVNYTSDLELLRVKLVNQADAA